MSLATFIARRYLFSPQSRSVVNLISGLSVVAVAVPVAAMVILLAVFNGFEALVRTMYSSFDADLRITPATGAVFEAESLDSAALRDAKGVAALSFTLEQSILAEHKGHQATTVLRGVDDHYGEVFPMEEITSSGRWAVRTGEIDRLYIGQALAHSLFIRSLADADVELYAARRGTFSMLLPIENYTRRKVSVAGTFSLDMESETGYALTSLRLARELLRHEGRASAVVIRVADDADTEEVGQIIKNIVGEDFRVETRDEQRASFYRIMRLEKWGIFTIALMVLAVASFSVVGALAMIIVEKREHSATLRAMGASADTLRSIFRREGYLICGLGGIAGLLTGVALTAIQQRFGLVRIPAETFLTDHYPVALHAADIAAVAAAFSILTLVLSHLTVRSMIKKQSV